MERIHTLLLQAIEGEMAAEVQYRQNAIQAQEEGYPKVGTLFSALARAEAIHIANHQRALEKNGFTGELPRNTESVQMLSTMEGLEASIRAEEEEFKRMYPSFRRQIKRKHGQQFEAKIGLLSLKWAQDSEEKHHTLLESALALVAGGHDVHGGDYYLCSVCGNIHFGAEAPAIPCEVCGHDILFYTRIDGEE